MNKKLVLKLLREYDRLDRRPSKLDEIRMREILKLISPVDVEKAGYQVFRRKAVV